MSTRLTGRAILVIFEKNTGSYPAKDPDVLHWLSKVAAPCSHFLRIADIPASRKLSNWLLGDINVVQVFDPTVSQPCEAVIDHEGVKKILEASGLPGKDCTDKKIGSFLENLSKAFNVQLSNGKLGKNAALFLGAMILSCHLPVQIS